MATKRQQAVLAAVAGLLLLLFTLILFVPLQTYVPQASEPCNTPSAKQTYVIGCLCAGALFYADLPTEFHILRGQLDQYNRAKTDSAYISEAACIAGFKISLYL